MNGYLVSAATVQRHVTAAFAKIGAKGRQEAITFVKSAGLMNAR